MGITLTEINKAEALRYMGYGRNKPDDITMRNIIECEKALLETIKPEYVYRIFDRDTRNIIGIDRKRCCKTPRWL